ncbi:TMEM128 family protein [Kitasatospora sp. NPDC002227]|uniref:TMEM128 family protein n=1 Tax=Kitasatospora sp. NPDC002227 TaxID=3154773 RepID=UPI003317365C
MSETSFTIYIAAFVTLILAACAAQREAARRGWRRAPQIAIALSTAIIVLSVIHLAVSVWTTYQWLTGQCSGTRFAMTVLGAALGYHAQALIPEPEWSRRTA